MPDDTVQTDRERYTAALHAVQTGVAFSMQVNPAPTSPKHLRVGVNAALVQDSVLVKLLMDKGILTEAEYFAALADAMEAERDRYAAELGPKVTLR